MTVQQRKDRFEKDQKDIPTNKEIRGYTIRGDTAAKKISELEDKIQKTI